MNMPGFTAGLPLRRSSSQHKATIDHAFTDDRSVVVPAQQCCGTGSGPCTGWFGGTTTATLARFARTCTGAYQYPWITVCRDINSGSVTAVASGCGFCWF